MKKTKRVLHSIANKMSQHLRDIFTEEEFQCYDAWSNAYLEKQGEQKETLCDKCKKVQPSHSCQDITALGRCAVEHEQKLADNLEPKFKVGDWVVYNRNDHSREIMQIYDIRDGRYYFTDNVHFSWSVKECDEKSHFWSIEDAKDGDVLICGVDKRPFIFKGLLLDTNHPNYPVAYCGINLERDFHISLGNHWWTNDDTQPATKEQCDLLFQKMHEAGYEWDAEKKELRISDFSKHIKYEPNSPSITEENDAWSEEDEKMLKDTIRFCELCGNKVSANWLKSIKERYTWKPSEEDEEMFNRCIKTMKGAYYQDGKALRWLENRFKSLVLQNKWKPSDEQMKALKEAIDEHFDIDGDALWHLYNDLKKLKEE